MSKTTQIVRIAFYSALALIMHYLESLIPPIFAFAPNVKLGLANLVTLVVLFTDGIKSGYAVTLIRCVLASLFAGNVTSLIYSLPSAIIAFSIQVLLVYFFLGKIGIYTVSVCGAVAFNATQSIIACFITQTNLSILITYYLPAGFIAGLFVGICARLILKAIPDKFYIKNNQKDKNLKGENI